MDDEKLFGKFFRRGLFGRDSWAAWRVFLAALFGLPLSPEQMEVYTKQTGRSDVSVNQYREAFCVCGRRAGKSSVASLIALYIALFVDHSETLAPGEEGVILLIAPDRKQTQQILGFVRGMLKESKTLRSMVAEGGELTESVRFKNSVRIDVGTANQRLVRGRTILAAIVDECAFLPTDEGSANVDSELFAALRPSMLTVPNAILLGISSPYAKRGVLWESHKNYFGQRGADVFVWQADTRSMNPRASLIEISRAYLKDRPAAEAEYGAQFRSDLESFLGQTPVENCVVRNRFELAYRSGIHYSAFCDPSGGRNDSMTLAVAHMENETAVLDLVRQCRAPFTPTEVVQEFCAELKRFHLYEITGDRYSGEWVSSEFEKHGVSYRSSERSKSELFLEIFSPILSKSVELLDHRELILQLSTLERRTTGRGRDSVDHGYNAHDDVANAAAGALVLSLGECAGGRLTWIEKLKEIAAGIAKGTLRDDGTPKQAATPAAAALPQANSKPQELELPYCPLCKDLKIRLKSFGSSPPADRICPQCGATFMRDGTLVSKPQQEDPKHVHRWHSIPGGWERCDDDPSHLRFVGDGQPPSTNGMSRAQWDARDRRPYGRFSGN